MMFTPPFLVFEGLDLTFYDSLKALEQELEGVDVEDCVYEVFDAKGRVIHFEATGVWRGKYTVEVGRTHVASLAETPVDAERLRSLLRNHLRAVGHSMPQDAALNDLVAKNLAVHKHGS